MKHKKMITILIISFISLIVTGGIVFSIINREKIETFTRAVGIRLFADDEGEQGNTSYIIDSRLGNLTKKTTGSKWIVTTATEEESLLTFWTLNNSKKTELGWIPPNNDCSGWTDKYLYDENNERILDDKDKDIQLKCESSKCNGSNCYHISLTEAQAVNIDDYVRLGENSIITEYQELNLINYNLDWADVNITLYKNISNSWNNTVNDIWVYNNPTIKKFGANDSNNNGTWRYKYHIKTTRPIIEKNLKPYIYDPERKTTAGLMSYSFYESHVFDFSDICNRGFECYNITEDNETYETCNISADCKFNYYNEITVINETYNYTFYYLDVNFTSNMFIDPLITIDQSEVVSNSLLINVTAETGASNHTHLTISTTAPYDSLIGYWSFDGDIEDINGTTHYDWTDHDNDGTGNGAANVTSTGCMFGNCIGFDSDLDWVDAGDMSELEGTDTFAVMGWLKNRKSGITDTGTEDFFSKSGTGDGDIFYMDYTQGEDVRFDIGNETDNALGYGAQIATCTDGIADGTADVWHHVAGVYNGTHIFIMIDGSRCALEPHGGVTVASEDNFVFGDWNQGADDGWDGWMDEVMVFNTSLTESQVQGIYNNQSARFVEKGKQNIRVFPNPVGWYMDDNGDFSLEEVYRIKVSGGYLYSISQEDHVFSIWNISSHGNPVPLGSYFSNSGAYSVEGVQGIDVSGDYAYTVSSADDNLVVWNISSHGNPVPLGNYTSSAGVDSLDGASTVKVLGNYAYTTSTNDDTFAVWNISSHGNPVFLGSYSSSSGNYSLDSCYDLYVSGDYAYTVSAVDDNLVVWNISSHGNPVPLGNYNSSTPPYSVDGVYRLYEHDNYVATCSYNDDMVVIWNVSSHGNPIPLWNHTSISGDRSVDGCRAIHIKDNYLYVSSAFENQITIWDIKNKKNPTFVTNIIKSNPPHSLDNLYTITTSEDYLYTAEYTDNGITILQLPSNYNRINISTELNNRYNSKINLSINYYNGSWGQTSPQSITSNTYFTFTLGENSTYLFLNYTLIAGDNYFYTPIILDNISINTWSLIEEEEPDETPPSISTPPSNYSTSNMSIAWEVIFDEASNMTGSYGVCPSYTNVSTFTNTTKATTLRSNQTSLNNATTYCYNMTSFCDATGNCNTSLYRWNFTTLQTTGYVPSVCEDGHPVNCSFPNSFLIDKVLNMSCYCNTTSDSWCRNLNFTGQGTWNISATVSTKNWSNFINGMIIWLEDNVLLNLSD